jgi:Tfp pilus assembly protein FimV
MNFQEKRMLDLNRTPLIRASLGWALWAGALTLAGPAFSAEPSPAGGSAAAQAASKSGAAAVKYTVREGDTLDKVIRLHMGNSPLRIEILRDAVVKQNPHAFVKGSTKVLLANAVITVPNHTELLQMQLGSALPKAEAAPPATTNTSMVDDRRKTWVRYP